MRLPWEQVHRADWDTEERTLTVERVEDWGRPTARWTHQLDEPGALLVAAPRAGDGQHRAPAPRRRPQEEGLLGDRRRPPGGGGAITWAYQFDAGVDPDDPAVMALAEASLRDAQESLGLR